MQKNVASQKAAFFAFDATTNQPKTGDSANITAYVSKDFGAVTVLTDTTATEMDSTNAKGYYIFDLAQAETNADTLLFSAKSTTSNIVVIAVPACVFTTYASFNADVAQTGDNYARIGATGSGLTSLAPSSTALSTVQWTNARAGYLDNINNSNLASVPAFPSNFASLAITAGGIVQADLQTIKTQTVTCSAGVTVNTNIGTTQPVNFTGTGSTAYVKCDMVDIAGSAVSTTTAQIGVNAVNWGGTAVGSAAVRSNVIQVGGSTTPVTNLGVVFETDFATNYDTILDMWNVNTKLLAGSSFTYSGSLDLDVVNAAAATVQTNLNATITSRMATYTQPTGFLAATFPATVASTTNITTATGVRLSATGVDDIWDEVQSGHTTSGTFGKYLDAQVSTVGGGTAASIADAVWDEVLSGHLTAGSTGAALNAAGSAGDPWSTTLPGSYTGNQAGFKFGTLFATALNILHPYVGQDSSLELVIGDSYYAADNRSVQFTYGASPSLSGATVYLDIQTDTGEAFDDNNMTSTTGSASGTVTQLVAFDLPSTTTDDFEEGWRAYRVRAVLSNGHTITLTRGRLNMLSRGEDAP